MEYRPSSPTQPPNPNPSPNCSMPLQSVTQYTSYPQPQNQNPNPNHNYHLQNEDQSITPPGVVSYVGYPISVTHQQNESLNHPGAEPYSYYPDPYAQNWAAQECTDNPYIPQDVIMPTNGTEQLALGVSSSTMWPTPMFQRHAKKNLQRLTPKTKIVQSVYCEVCQLSCNTKDVLSKHKLGKKHKKNLDKQKATLVPPQQPLPVSFAKPDSVPLIGPQENPSNGESTSGSKSKKFEGGATVDAAVYCSVCNVWCNSKDVLDKHNLGKKHMKNMEKEKLKAAVALSLPPPPVTSANPNSSPPVGPQENPSEAILTNGKKSEELGAGATVDAVLYCSVCNVWCNAQNVLNKHNLGKKHMKNMEKLKAEVAPSQPPPPVTLTNPNISPPVGPQENPSEAIPTNGKKSEEFGAGATVGEHLMCTVCNIWCNAKDVLDRHNLGKKHKKNVDKLTAAALQIETKSSPVGPQENPSEAIVTNEKKSEELRAMATVDERRMCTVCDIWCNTQDVLDRHNLGKKHKKNMDKLAALQQLPPSALETPDGVPLSGPQENTLIAKLGTGTKRSKKKQAESAEELEVKRRKLLEGGAAENEVRTCTVCNVICNSEKVFRDHVSGAKHIALVKKLG